MDFSDHVFTTMFEALNNALAGIVGKYAAVIGIVSPALRIGIVIYISLLGYPRGTLPRGVCRTLRGSRWRKD